MRNSRPNSNEYRKIYEDHFGKIPKGYHIHHIDRNPYNNSIENLVCLSPEEHSKIHESEYVYWANKGGKIGGKKCFKEKLGWFNKSEEELQKIRVKAANKSNTKSCIEKRVETYKKRYNNGEIVHWSKKYSKDIVSEKIKSGDPGKSCRGKESKNKGKKLNIKNLDLANERKRLSALNKKKIPCCHCEKLVDISNIKRHESVCKQKT